MVSLHCQVVWRVVWVRQWSRRGGADLSVRSLRDASSQVARKSEQVVPIALVEVAYDEAAAILQKTDFEEPPLKELLRRLPKSMKRITTSKV